MLITGAGPTGILAAAVVRKAGARYVVIAYVNPRRLKLAEKIGVTLAVNPGEVSLADVYKDVAPPWRRRPAPG